MLKKALAHAWFGFLWALVGALILGIVALVVYWVTLSPELQALLLCTLLVAAGVGLLWLASKVTDWASEVLDSGN